MTKTAAVPSADPAGPDRATPTANPAGRPLHPVKLWREANGVTLDAMAANCGVSKPTLSKLENGRLEPSFPLLRRILIATAGGVTADRVVWWGVQIALEPMPARPSRRAPARGSSGAGDPVLSASA